jgi:hypothetical protein
MKYALVPLVFVVGCRAGLAAGPAWYSGDSGPSSSVQLEVGGYGEDGIGGFATVVKTSVDDGEHVDNADLRIWLLGDVRYRRVLANIGKSFRLYGAVGIGLGLDARIAVAAGHLELGIEWIIDRRSLDISLRYRPVALLGGGETMDAHVVQLAFSFGRAH